MTTIAIVQARSGSVRFPNKVLQPILGTPVIELLLDRLARSRRLDRIVLATTTDPRDDELAGLVAALGYRVFRGSEADVLDRYYQAATVERCDTVVRITGDCPLVDPGVVDEVVSTFFERGVDYLTNTEPPTYPDGFDVEVFSYGTLARAWREAIDQFDREHVTPYMRRPGKFSIASMTSLSDLSHVRLTLDEPADLGVIAAVFEHFHPRRDFILDDVADLVAERPGLFEPNARLARNHGAAAGAGQKLWSRARRVIPGGSMLLSKRAEMFLPERWPAYFSRARGCTVWDLDGREYADMSMMGIGTNILGYAHPRVDAAARAAIDAGNMSTLNSPEEVHLAERLVSLHPWSAMVRFARSGGEANAIAVRIARAAAGKDKVAVCGYHGWHDWYLAANLGDDQRLAGHLLPGLEPRGVPQALRGTTLPFTYNRIDELEALVQAHPDIGVISMEVSRSERPAPGFLERVREIASGRGIVLIFDECTSGFRETFGGLHLRYGVHPDIAVFGKALGNGYALTAVIGRREVMESAQESFISSTFWTERMGPAAALATLDEMERIRSWELITRTGTLIRERWAALAERHGLPLTLSGLPALSAFSFGGPRASAYKTLITQEMLRHGFLAGNSVYVSTAHDDETIDRYFECLDPVFGSIAECEKGRDVTSLLEGPVCHEGFTRLS